MTMPDKQDFEQAICQIRQRLSRAGESAKTFLAEVEGVQQDFEGLLDRFAPSLARPDSAKFKSIATANGKVLPPGQIKGLDEADYDIVLDCIKKRLLSQSQPGKHGTLKARSLAGIGQHRMTLLRFMLEHPDWPVCDETFSVVYGDKYIYTPNALAKTISCLRKCLGNPSYIVTDNWAPESRTAHAYKMSSKYKYLVVRYDFLRT